MNFGHGAFIPDSIQLPDSPAIRRLLDEARRMGLPEWWIGPDRSQLNTWFQWDGCTVWDDGSLVQHLPCWWHDVRSWVGGDAKVKKLTDKILREERRLVCGWFAAWCMWGGLRLARRLEWLPGAKFWHDGADRLRMTPGELHLLQDEETELASALHTFGRGGMIPAECLEFARNLISNRSLVR